MPQQPSFSDFYADHFIHEHAAPANIALHLAGTIGGLALLLASLTVIPLAWALLFPVVHVLPGLIGHRLFERNQAVGNLRLTRTDFPLYWFVIANHVMTWNLLTGRHGSGDHV